MNKWLTISLALLLALAVLLGLAHNDADLFNFSKHSSTESSTATFLAVGDIMLSRDVAGQIAKANDPLLPFHNVETLLQSTDFNFGNLESPLSGKNTFYFPENAEFNTPPAYAVGLKQYNFSLLNLANNHALDQDQAGVDYTRQFFDQQGIAHIGTGSNLDQAWQGQVITSHGVRIGFVGASYASSNDGGYGSNNYVARLEDTQRLTAAVADLRQRADLVVVTMHAGTEYTRTPNAEQVAFAHAAIDAGADLVIGAHPHWVQPTETYQGKTIFYSLGNFVFDQMWSQDTKEGLALKVTAEKSAQTTRIQQIELIPVIIENYCCPRLATTEEAQTILAKINLTSPILYP